MLLLACTGECCLLLFYNNVERVLPIRVSVSIPTVNSPLSLSGRTRSMLSIPHISHSSSTYSNHSDTVWSDETP